MAASPRGSDRLPTSAVWLSALALIGAGFASFVTLTWAGSFPSPTAEGDFNPVMAEARGWSLVTLALALPLGACAVFFGWRGSLRGRVLVAGTAAYLLYTYLELAVSGPFTPLYLVYVGTFACALPTLVIAAASLDGAELDRRLGTAASRTALIIYSFVVALGLAAAWLRSIVHRSIEQPFGWPSRIDSVAQVVQALDLGLQVPLFLATGIALWRRHPAGPVLAGIAITMATFMSTALTAMVAMSAVGSHQSLAGVLPFAALSAITVGLGFAALRRASARARRERQAAPWHQEHA